MSFFNCEKWSNSSRFHGTQRQPASARQENSTLHIKIECSRRTSTAKRLERWRVGSSPTGGNREPRVFSNCEKWSNSSRFHGVGKARVSGAEPSPLRASHYINPGFRAKKERAYPNFQN